MSRGTPATVTGSARAPRKSISKPGISSAMSEGRPAGEVEEAEGEGGGGEGDGQAEDDSQAATDPGAALREGHAEAGDRDGDDPDGLGHGTGHRVGHALQRSFPRHA